MEVTLAYEKRYMGQKSPKLFLDWKTIFAFEVLYVD
jgi:hypothetical protein